MHCISSRCNSQFSRWCYTSRRTQGKYAYTIPSAYICCSFKMVAHVRIIIEILRSPRIFEINEFFFFKTLRGWIEEIPAIHASRAGYSKFHLPLRPYFLAPLCQVIQASPQSSAFYNATKLGEFERNTEKLESVRIHWCNGLKFFDVIFRLDEL